METAAIRSKTEGRRSEVWPSLPLAAWEDTRATLHLWTQIVGKTRLALAPMENHWWQVALYVTARGLGTSPMPYGDRTLDIEFDFIDHKLTARTNDGAIRALPLEPQSVSDFHERYRTMLRALGLDAAIWPTPVEIANPIPFPQDRTHGSYDSSAARRFWDALVQADRVLKEYRGRYLGKSSPVHFWWGSFDLACTRFSGRPAPPHPGGIPNTSDSVTREAYSHECMSVGWWPGMPGTPVDEPVFYAYAYPEPPGCKEAVIRPAEGAYHHVLSEWILPYEAVRTAPDPDAALLDFAQSTYETAAELGGWDRGSLERGYRRGAAP